MNFRIFSIVINSIPKGLYHKVKLIKKMYYYKYLWCKATHPLRPLPFKERGLGGELIDRQELIDSIIMHDMYLMIQSLKGVSSLDVRVFIYVITFL
jgi:hypothetical protein